MAVKTLGKTFRISESDLQDFERLYPELLPLFVQRAVRLAVQSRADFEHIFFTGLPVVGSPESIN